MDFSLGSIRVSAGFNTDGPSAGDSSLASKTSEVVENKDQRMVDANGYVISPSPSEFFSNLCRSATEVDLDSMDDRIIPSLKLARTEYSSRRLQPELPIPTWNGGPAGQLIRNRSMQSDSCRLPTSLTNSRFSDDSLLGGDSRFVADQTSSLLRGDYLLGSHPLALRQFPSQESYVLHRQSGFPVLLEREAAAMLHAGMHDAAVAVAIGGRCLFTASQWAELEHQALIYKYILHGAHVPAELLHPLRRSVAAMSSGMHHNLINPPGWGGFQLGAATINVDPEPGRCRRTDGKKWRCARPVVLEQKYCERHMHRGRHRRKTGEAAQIMSNSPSQVVAGSPPSSTVAAGRLVAPDRSIHMQYSSALAQAHSVKTTSTMAFNAVQQPLLTKSLSSLAAMAGSVNAVQATSTSDSAQNLKWNQSPFPVHSATSLPTNQDNRFSCLGINKAHFCFHPEQLLSDFSESARGLDPRKVSALPSDQLVQWHPRQSKVSPFDLSSSCGSLLRQDCDQTEPANIARAEMMNLAEVNRLNQLLSQHQQHNNLLESRNLPMKMFNGDFKYEHQPLRHFFDDWPRTKEAASTLSIWQPDDHEKPKTKDSSTHLSISITTAACTSDTGSPSRAKPFYSPLNLSILKNSEDMPDNSPHMGLSINNDHQKSSWFSTALDISVGGPLGEVVQSSAHSVRSKDSPKEEWDIAHSKDALNTASPTGILQKPTLGCSSDSSSNASSPGSVRTEHADQNPQNLALPNTPCTLLTT